MFINELEKAMEVEEASRQGASPIRLSNTGKCPMSTYLKICGLKTKPLDPRVLLMFRTGDLSEQAFKDLAKKHMEGKTWDHFVFGKETSVIIDEEPATIYKQIEVKLEWENFTIEGHLDGIGLKTWNDPYVIEFKTMSNYAFEKFEKGIIDTDYIWQTQAYMEATKINKALIIAQRKETGHMAEQIVKRDEKYDCKARWEKILKATPTNLPTREGAFTEKDGVIKIGYPCSYCSFYETCYKQVNLSFVKGKPALTANKIAEPKEISDEIMKVIEVQKPKVINLKGEKK